MASRNRLNEAVPAFHRHSTSSNPLVRRIGKGLIATLQGGDITIRNSSGKLHDFAPLPSNSEEIRSYLTQAKQKPATSATLRTLTLLNRPHPLLDIKPSPKITEKEIANLDANTILQGGKDKVENFLYDALRNHYLNLEAGKEFLISLTEQALLQYGAILVPNEIADSMAESGKWIPALEAANAAHPQDSILKSCLEQARAES